MLLLIPHTAGCFSNQVKTQSALDSRAQFQSHSCHVVCCICSETVPDHTVATASPDDFALFLKAKEDIVTRNLVKEYETRI